MWICRNPNRQDEGFNGGFKEGRIFLHCLFDWSQGSKENLIFCWSFLIDIYFVPFSNEKDLQTLERSKGWPIKPGKICPVDESCLSNLFPRHGHGPHGWMSMFFTFAFRWSHRYWPIPRNEEEHSFCRTPDQMRHWFPACARTRWVKAAVFCCCRNLAQRN